MSSTDKPRWKVVFVNGPPRSGKDTVGQLIKTDRKGRDLGPTCLEKFAHAVKRAVHDRLGLKQAEHDPRPGRPLPADYYEQRKDEVGIPGFPDGKSPRDMYIEFSEDIAKPAHGDDVFGQFLLGRLVRKIGDNEMVVITDSGFRPEAECIVEHYGAENCLLIRLERDGSSFEGDSRDYIELADLGVTEVDLSNDYETQPELLEALRAIEGLL